MFNIELLTADHFVDDFDCGDERKNSYLKKFALQNTKGGLARTFVAVPSGDSLVQGYYSISSSSVKFENLGNRKLPRYPIPAILIGKLAVDITAQKRGLGTALLFNALKRAARVSEEIGIFLVEIEAVNEPAKKMYLDIGFSEMLDSPMKLFMNLKKVRKLLDK
jgi:ribosomal protein S18 acetylase RimI-like enzyme